MNGGKRNSNAAPRGRHAAPQGHQSQGFQQQWQQQPYASQQQWQQQPYASQQQPYVPQRQAYAAQQQRGYSSQQAFEYSRDRYGTGGKTVNPVSMPSKKSGKKRALKRVGLGVLSILLVLILGGLAWAFWYSSALNGELALDETEAEAVNRVLTPTSIGEPFYLLVIGSDSREGSGTSDKAAEQGDNQRSDVMMLVRIDAPNNKITMLSIPRDTPYHTGDSVVKLNELYNQGGAAATIRGVSEITGAPISHYAEVRFSELEGIVEQLGGVTVNVDTPLSYVDALTGETVSIPEGKQTLDGKQAQIFARARHEYQDNQDAHRQDNVRLLAQAILKKALDRPVYELPGVLLNLASCVGTDMKAADIGALGFAFSQAPGKMTMYSGSGPSDGAVNEQLGGAWMCYENPDGWAELMRVVDAGEDPQNVDVSATAIIP